MPQQEIILPGVANARELGGYAIGEKHIRKGLLLRSGKLTDATPEALNSLQEKYRVQTVVDLRMTVERNMHPEPEVPGAENLHLPLMEMDEFKAIGPELLQEYADGNRESLALFNAAYKIGMFDEQLYSRALLPECGKKAWKGFFRALLALEEDRALLWHCVDGKDRAGCAAMLLLFALGADRETVLRDYMLTNEFIPPREFGVKGMLLFLWPKVKVKALRFATGTVFERYMNSAIDTLNREYGSVTEYLRQEIGVDAAEREALRARFLE